jgi:hypothetical protein
MTKAKPLAGQPKMATLLKLISPKAGATEAQLARKLGWLEPTLRAAVNRLRPRLRQRMRRRMPERAIDRPRALPSYGKFNTSV